MASPQHVTFYNLSSSNLTSTLSFTVDSLAEHIDWLEFHILLLISTLTVWERVLMCTDVRSSEDNIFWESVLNFSPRWGSVTWEPVLLSCLSPCLRKARTTDGPQHLLFTWVLEVDPRWSGPATNTFTHQTLLLSPNFTFYNYLWLIFISVVNVIMIH